MLQGAPFVCVTCNGVGHLKSQCPELIIPTMIELPQIGHDWFKVLSDLCRQITSKRSTPDQRIDKAVRTHLDRCQPTKTDIEHRETILEELQKQCRKDFPLCDLHAFGSFYNGFGFRHSDLDVCIVFKDERECNVSLGHRPFLPSSFSYLTMYFSLIFRLTKSLKS